MEKSIVTSLAVISLCISSMASLMLNCNFANCGVTSFFWLKPRTSATYLIPDEDLIFDDKARGYPFRGNYSWLCVDLNDTHAVLDVEVALELFKRPEWTTPAHIAYFGSEFVEMTKRGDLSFIKRIPLDQVIGRMEIDDGPDNPGIYIPSPIMLYQKFTATVDLDTMMMVDENGEPWGKWVLWIDPLKYPLDQKTNETFIMNWLNTTVDVEVFYLQSPSRPLDTIFGVIDKRFYAGVVDPIRHQFLEEMGKSSMILTYHYESRTGVLLSSSSCNFLDDVLTQRLGVVGVTTVNPQNLETKLQNIAFLGDLNIDWVVNIADIAVVAKAFNTKIGEAKWNGKADVNKDETVNIVDITIVAKAFGTQYITSD